MDDPVNFDPEKLLKLRDEMLAASAASDKHMEESDRLFRDRNNAEHAFTVYARGGQKALDELNQAISEMAEQDRAYQKAILNSGCGAGGQYIGPGTLSKGRLS